LVPFAQVLATAVAVQNGRTGIAAQSLHQGNMSELAAVGSAKLPAQHFTGREVHDQRQVVQAGADT